MTKLLGKKFLCIWAAISCVLIIAGVVLSALLGFNYVADETKTVEVTYDAFVKIELKDEALADLCEKAFKDAGLKYSEKTVSTELDSGYISPTGDMLLTYTFASGTSDEALAKVVTTIREKVAAEKDFENAEIFVSAHALEGEQFVEAIWRGAVALLVAAIVALVYVGFRFGIANAVAGLTACANGSLLTVFLFALTRLPVYAYTPMLFAGIGAVLSLIFWIAQSMKMRENFKDPAYAALSAQEAVGQSVLSSWKFLLWFVVPMAAVLVVFGAVASAGLRLFMLSALIPLAVSVYSSLLLAPAVLVPLKNRIDRFKNKRKRYTGKQKANAEEE